MALVRDQMVFLGFVAAAADDLLTERKNRLFLIDNDEQRMVYDYVDRHHRMPHEILRMT